MSEAPAAASPHGAGPQSPSERGFLPTTRQLLLGSVRATLGLAVVLLAWNLFGIDQLSESAFVALSRAVATRWVPEARVVVHEPDSTALGGFRTRTARASIQVNRGLGAAIYVSASLASLVFLLLPRPRLRQTLQRMALAGLLALGLLFALEQGLLYQRFSARIAVLNGESPPETLARVDQQQKVFSLAAAYYVFPVLAALGSHLLLRAWERRRSKDSLARSAASGVA